MVFTIVATLFLRFWYIRENKRRDELAEVSRRSAQSSHVGSRDKLDTLPSGAQSRDSSIVEKLEDYRDLTDRERIEFRYVY